MTKTLAVPGLSELDEVRRLLISTASLPIATERGKVALDCLTAIDQLQSAIGLVDQALIDELRSRISSIVYEPRAIERAQIGIVALSTMDAVKNNLYMGAIVGALS